MFHFKIIVFLLVATVAISIASLNKLTTRNLFVLHEWKEMEFRFPLEVDREFAVENGLYVKGVGIPIDFDFEFKDKKSAHRIFVTLPRLTLGVPYTLATVEDNYGNQTNSHFFPYPDYSTHASHGADCKGITSAIRIFIDECKRLWVVDSGQVASVQFCPPQILAFDLETDRLTQRYVLPQNQYTPGISVFTSILADWSNQVSTSACENTKIYIADSWGFGLIVFDTAEKVSWRIENSFMRPENSLQRDGIFTISLSPRNAKERYLFFHSLGSKNEIFVPLQVINDRSRWINKSTNNSSSNDFKILGNRGIPCESETMDSFGNLYCSVLNLNALIRWDSRTDYNSDNLKIYAYNPEQIKFVTGMKVLKNSFGQDELWILSTEPKIFSGVDLAEDEIKFRLIGCRISDLLSGRRCTVDALT